MFIGLIQRCEQIALPTVSLSQALSIFDERFYGLPNLIDALSSIIIEMPHVSFDDCMTYRCIHVKRLDWRRISWTIGTTYCHDYRLLSTLSTEISMYNMYVDDEIVNGIANENILLQTISFTHRSVE
jgi:hypothetical protein